MTKQNQHPKLLRIADYNYSLPQEKIAQYPLAIRDQSKLLVYKNATIQDDIYQNIATHLPENALVIFNETKVVQVRLLFHKESGAKIEIFCLEPDARYKDIQSAMCEKSEVYWKCLVGGANKWKQGTSLSLFNDKLQTNVVADLIERQVDGFIIRISWGATDISFAEVLHEVGKVPLPPYMNREMNEADKERYQTIFAKTDGSVAAPTAGLHFTDAIFSAFEKKGIRKAFLTLHVGAGTFKQVKSEQLAEHEMHAEWIDISLSFLERLAQHNGAVISVGTTSMRSLESLYWIGLKLYHKLPVDFENIAVNQWDAYEIECDIDSYTALYAIIDFLKEKKTERLVTRTQIFIAPSYKTKIVQQLITNFHQPSSTLLLLVAALIGDDWKRVYQHALDHDYRFLSYGDGCLIQF